MHTFLVLAAFFLFNIAVSSSCPETCTCENEGEVLCRNAGLVTIPEDLGIDTAILDLSYNNFTVIENGSFEKIPTLKIIIVAYSGVEVVHPEVFKGLEFLETVDLHSNTISSIHPSLFQENVNLAKLDLSFNIIETFNPSFASELKFLNLSGNMLNSEGISSLIDLTSLETLDLSNNHIETLSSDIFEGMENLRNLDISGNIELEYDCRLGTLWSFCTSRNINCNVGDEEKRNILENCDAAVSEITTEPDGLIAVEETEGTSEASGTEGEVEGSGVSEVDGAVSIPDSGDGTEETIENAPEDMVAEVNWILIVIIVCSICAVILVITIGVICFIRRRKSRESSAGNLSHTNSIEYLNQEDEFNRSYKNSRNESNRVRNNNFDRVAKPAEIVRTDIVRDVLHLGTSATADVMRVPSFKTQGIATPLNLPQEVSPVDATSNSRHSLPRVSSALSYPGNNALRATSLRKHNRTEQIPVPDIQMGVRRVPSNRRR